MKLPPIQSAHNVALAAIFHRMADCYKYLGEDEKFRAIAYDTAAKTISSLKEDIAQYAYNLKTLEQLPGIGESIGKKIVEYLQTGSIATYEKLKKKVPQDLMELMDVKGFGPSTLRLLHDELHINTKEELREAILEGKLNSIKGMGQKRIDNLRRILKLYKNSEKRIPLATAEKLGTSLLKQILLIPEVHRASLAGSLRRKKETVGDIDIVATAERNKWKSIVNKFVQLPIIGSVIAKGETRASVLLKEKNVQVDVRIVQDHEYGAALLYFTGSKEHNIQLRKMAKQKGWKINEYGVFDIKTGHCLASATEEAIYALFGINFIPPEERGGKDELERYKK